MFNSIWYQNLIKPSFAPPDWIFAPMWSVLYITILVAFVLYFTKYAQYKKTGYIYFGIQMLLNAAWPFMFFFFKDICFAFAVIVLLDVFVFLTIKKFYSVSKTAGIVLVPYFVWIIYATILNGFYCKLN